MPTFVSKAASIYEERALVSIGFGDEAFAEVGDDLFLHFFAAGAPALGAGETFGAVAQTAKTEYARGLAELGTEFIAEPLEEKELEGVGGIPGDGAEIGFEGLRARFPLVGKEGEAEALHGFFEGDGKFADGDRFAFKIHLEIMENGGGGVMQHFGRDEAVAVADDLDTDHFGGAGDALTVGELENEAIGLEGDHLVASSFLTSCTKSVASSNRRYTLAKRT